MNNKKIVIAGGTGFIGQALAAFFGRNNDIVILGRHLPDDAFPYPTNRTGKKLLTSTDGYRIRYLRWDGLRVEKSWAQAIDGCDLVINLAGKSVNCRYTPKNKQAIFDSRTDSTRALGLAIRDAVTPPKVWINAASATIYRHAEDHPQDEYTGEFEDDFSVQVCKRWEETFEQQRAPFTRKITLRIAITLGNGGVFIPYLHLLKFGLSGRQGNGRQMYSWVHIDDLCRAIKWIYERNRLEGVYNVCSPHPLNNKEFMRTLRKASGHHIGLPAFTWMLKLGAWLIGTETELILKSRWVLPTKLQDAGFIFRYTDAEDAIRSVLEKIPRKKYHLF
ncbi:MAG TPA: TIGR01777 family oxidoreductase [Puia sp.]|nr:TIGR01777 family oxidoreductase [Puia sp.]